MNQITLKELFHYDPETGLFTNKTKRGWNALPGAVAGSLFKNGYLGISIGGKRYYAHRLAWLFVHGSMPDSQIDHVDGDKTNNRIANIRLATSSDNMCNRGAFRNKSGAVGVSWNSNSGKWIVQVAKGRKYCYGGLFDDFEDAKAAAVKLRESLHGEFTADARRKEVMPMLLGKESA
jgi:hypothetical protein